MSLILNDEKLFKEWCGDIETMAQRIISMRSKLFELLTEKFKTPSPGPNGWEHVKSQIGMFTFTGLNRESFTLVPSSLFHTHAERCMSVL